MSVAVPGQIWRDDCYYLDEETAECKRKYVLVLAVEASSGDAVTAVLTSKSHGLTTQPACCSGPPRAGYYVGTPGGVLAKPSWVSFSDLQMLDGYDLQVHVRTGRKTLLTQTLPPNVFCAVLRCALRADDDVSFRQARLIGDTAAALRCP